MYGWGPPGCPLPPPAERLRSGLLPSRARSLPVGRSLPVPGDSGALKEKRASYPESHTGLPARLISTLNAFRRSHYWLMRKGLAFITEGRPTPELAGVPGADPAQEGRPHRLAQPRRPPQPLWGRSPQRLQSSRLRRDNCPPDRPGASLPQPQLPPSKSSFPALWHLPTNSMCQELPVGVMCFRGTGRSSKVEEQ